MSTSPLAAASAALFLLSGALVPASARADTDACGVLAPAQIGAAVGVAVGAGQHVSPTFVSTCTWKATGNSPVKLVTLYLQTTAAYDGGKQMADMMAARGRGAAVQAATVGDDAYYFVAGDQVGLLVKKGSNSFKVSVYAQLPVPQKEAMELVIAKEVAATF